MPNLYLYSTFRNNFFTSILTLVVCFVAKVVYTLKQKLVFLNFWKPSRFYQSKCLLVFFKSRLHETKIYDSLDYNFFHKDKYLNYFKEVLFQILCWNFKVRSEVIFYCILWANNGYTSVHGINFHFKNKRTILYSSLRCINLHNITTSSITFVWISALIVVNIFSAPSFFFLNPVWHEDNEFQTNHEANIGEFCILNILETNEIYIEGHYVYIIWKQKKHNNKIRRNNSPKWTTFTNNTINENFGRQNFKLYLLAANTIQLNLIFLWASIANKNFCLTKNFEITKIFPALHFLIS